MYSRKQKADPSGARLWGEDVNGVMHVRRVPPLKLRLAQARRALDVAVRGTPLGLPNRRQEQRPGHGARDQTGRVERTPARRRRTIRRRLPWSRGGYQRALDGAKHVALLGPPVGGEDGTCGRGVTETAWCCHSVQAEASRKCVRRAWRMHGHSAIAKHVDKVPGRPRPAARACRWRCRASDKRPLASAGQADAPLVHA